MSTSTAATTATSPSMDVDQYLQNLTSKVSDTVKASAKAKSSTLGKNDFMNLLVTQLKYQDPLSPQDNSQMAAQMAQFSSLESMQNVQKAVEDLGKTFTSMSDKQTESASAINSSSATSMIGKSVRYKQETVAAPSTGSTTTLQLQATSGSVAVISDAGGNPVRTIVLDGTNDDGTKVMDANGIAKIAWDGKDDTGKQRTGTFTISVQDEATKAETGYAYQDSDITAVSFDSTGPMLKAGTQSFRMKDLMEVHPGTTSSSASSSSSATATATASSSTGADTTAALGMVGHTAKFRDPSADLATEDVTAADGRTIQASRAKWTFSAAAGSLGQILDSTGKVVKTFSVDGLNADGKAIMDSKKATGSYTWDGGDSNGEIVENGTYFLRIVDPTQTKTAGTAFREEKIDSVAFDIGGNPKLVSGTDVWSLSDLFTIV